MKTKAVIGLCVVATMVVVFGLANWLVETDMPKRDRYLIPENYSGWLCVTYSVPGARELEMENGYRLIQFTEQGVFETSTEGKPGKFKDEFWRYSGTTRRQMNVDKELGGGYTIAQSENSDHYTFKFWVSSDAKTQPIPENGKMCGQKN